MAKKATAKKRVVRVDAQGEAHIHSSFNNIIVALTNTDGQVISWSSAGKMGFRSSKRILPMQRRWRFRIVPRLHMIWECAK